MSQNAVYEETTTSDQFQNQKESGFEFILKWAISTFLQAGFAQLQLSRANNFANHLENHTVPLTELHTSGFPLHMKRCHRPVFFCCPPNNDHIYMYISACLTRTCWIMQARRRCRIRMWCLSSTMGKNVASCDNGWFFSQHKEFRRQCDEI